MSMVRNPMPDLGQRFDRDFFDHLRKAIAANPSIHDGAILFQKTQNSSEYELVAWSMRIVSQNLPANLEPNMGSAFNSVHALSMARSVDACCILSASHATLFVDGRFEML